jgi:hypothetical protein
MEEEQVKTDHYRTFAVAALVAIALSGMLAAQRGSGEKPTGPPPNPVHTHIGHVMTQWKDTPSTQGFLPLAVADGKVAAVHAGYMQKSPDNLDSIKLHAGHVLNALDPSIEAKGPGSGYGLKQATAGALEHLQLATKSEGASKNVLTHADHVTASLEDVEQWTDAAIATAQKIRAATTAASAAPLITELIQQIGSINSGMDANKDGKVGWQTGEGGLEQAQMHMGLMMKGEGL